MVLLLAFAAGGCGAQQVLLGTQDDYLFAAMDAVTVPGRAVDLKARLQGGDLLVPKSGYVVLFRRDGELYRAAETDADGVASAGFTPAAPGDYLFSAELSPNGFDGPPPAPAKLRVACRRPDEPILVTDLDRTIVADGFEKVLIGEAAPMPGSPELLRRAAKDRTIVYLTHRPGYFACRTKAWLESHGFPPGPVVFSSTGGFLSGSGSFKTQELARMRGLFTRMDIGIGDKVSDARAYVDCGMKAVLIIHPDHASSTRELRELAGRMASLPADVQVVTGWDQIGKILFEQASFPRPAVQVMLLERAAAMARDRTPPGPEGQ